MSVLAITTNQIAWWATLGVGLAVLGVVWALLDLVLTTVRDVGRRVDAIWAAGKDVAQNTQTTHLLQTTAARGGELGEELQRHRAPPEGG